MFRLVLKKVLYGSSRYCTELRAQCSAGLAGHSGNVTKSVRRSPRASNDTNRPSHHSLVDRDLQSPTTPHQSIRPYHDRERRDIRNKRFTGSVELRRRLPLRADPTGDGRQGRSGDRSPSNASHPPPATGKHVCVVWLNMEQLGPG